MPSPQHRMSLPRQRWAPVTSRQPATASPWPSSVVGGRGRQIIGGGDQVVAVCDVDADHCAKAKKRIEKMPGNGGCATYGDFREILARDDIDGVVIAVPDHWHAWIALAALKAGKAVFVEKPLSLTIREGRILSDAAKRYRAILQVGSQQRSDEKFIKACELVRNGRIGKLQTVRVEIPTRGGSDEPWTPQPVPPALDYNMWLGPAPWAPYHPDRCHYKFRFITDYSGGDVTNWGRASAGHRTVGNRRRRLRAVESGRPRQAQQHRPARRVL